MAWEEIVKKSFGGNCNRGAGWREYPCVAVARSGLSFNTRFVEAFGLKEGNRVHLLVDTQKRKLGIKIAVNGEPLDAAFKVQWKLAPTGNSITTMVAGGHIPKRFPDCVGRAYRAHMNPGERIIEVSLSPDNVV